ncbi:uncharacterized protein MAM_07103 [Metarhizium album ARSEF 1941]|uniref:Uncharacterized protein n=1 Tax=Metarhizium album (strain ARSEF 1941) TaxID=1081103 RepID=A0A0B2WMY8_METAS|nr:uncharacterized protein MAM_07103 [Metarhizium album ARSEF 1941]KHN95054.1 hypothetical protein MAM_07103 [Metarhizium album ARSEF 1941]
MPLNLQLLKRWLVGACIVVAFLVVFRERLPTVTDLRGHGHGHGHDHNRGGRDRDGFVSRDKMLAVVREWQERERMRRIVGLVFYRKRQEASILDCYLKRNLAKNGGVLDGVIWLRQTDDAQDLQFLDKLVRSEAHYSDQTGHADAARAYDGIEDDLLYVKVDSGIVYIEDGTILSMVHRRAIRPDLYLVSANVVNQPLSSWLHLSLGAVKPYLPDNETLVKARSGVSWRSSRLPPWRGPPDFDLDKWNPPAGRQHLWLPVMWKKDRLLDNTPIVHTVYDAYRKQGKWEWMAAAQQHFSLLENLERGELSKYKFHLWNYQELGMGTQLVAMTGRDINAAKPIDDAAERHLSVTVPRKTGRPAVADGRGVAAYYSSKDQYEALEKTDILERYRSFAQEHVCKGGMLWTPDVNPV